MSVIESQTAESVKKTEEQLILENMNLVKKIALHLLMRLPYGIEADDLIQSGMIGLMAAAKDYSPNHGASFATYAGIRIRGAILDDMRQNSWAPRSVQKKSQQISRAIREVESKTGEHATDRSLANELGVELEEYHEMLRQVASSQIIYFDIDIEEPGETLENPESIFEEERFKNAIRHAIEELPEREKLFVALYYQEELNLKEIGQVLGVSESRACQIHGQTVARIKGVMEEWTQP